MQNQTYEELEQRIKELEEGVLKSGQSTTLSSITKKDDGIVGEKHFLEYLEVVSQAMNKSKDVDQIIDDVLGAVFAIFGCDRIWLFHPCDPNAVTFRVLAEKNRPEYPGGLSMGQELPITSEAAKVIEKALASGSPIVFDPESGNQIDKISSEFSVLSQIMMAVHPRTGKPWMFGMHQCTHARVWSKKEQLLFKEISFRVVEGLNNQILLRDLKESEQKYRRFFTTVRNGWAYHKTITDEAGKPIDSIFLEVNKAFEQLTGLQAENIIGQRITEVLSPDEENLPWWIEKFGDVFLTGKDTTFEGYLNSVNRWYFVSVSSPEPGFFITVFEDISERKQAEEELQRYREHLEEVVNKRTAELTRANEKLCLQSEIAVNMSEGVFLVRVSDGNIIYTNPRFEEIFGYNSGEMVGKHASIVNAPTQMTAEKTVAHIVRNIKQTGVWQGEIQNVKKDGTLFWCYTSASLVESPDYGEIIVSVHTDIDERKRMDEKLREAKEVAEKANRSKSEFLANMSHEIRTPMNVILGLNRLVLDTDLSPKQRKYLSTVQQSSESLLNILDDILDFSKIEAGQLTITERPFELTGVLGAVVQAHKLRAREKGLDLSYTMNSDVPVRLVGDDLRLNQILNNLIANAVKFTASGSVTVNVSLVFHDKEHTIIRFRITDTGIGIPEELQAKVFDSFSQMDNSISRRFGGTGLGLAICKKLTEMLGGEIGIESEHGKGSAFYFTVRLKLDTTAELAANENIQINEVPSHSLNILLVEDNQFNQDLATIVLEKEGHTVNAAMNGLEALELLTNKCFDLILMDVQMPELDGMTATKHIRQCEQDTSSTKTEHQDLLRRLRARIKGKHVPIIAMTAHSMSGDREKCLESGMDDYVTKPFKPDELFAVFRRVTAQSSS